MPVPLKLLDTLAIPSKISRLAIAVDGDDDALGAAAGVNFIK